LHFVVHPDESFKNASATGGAAHNENRVTFANIKRSFDVYQDLDIQAARQALTERTRLNQIASQALQNAVETANMVGKRYLLAAEVCLLTFFPSSALPPRPSAPGFRGPSRPVP
jgi:hypothetical protein